MVGALEHEWIMFFYSVGNVTDPNWRTSFFRGVYQQPGIRNGLEFNSWFYGGQMVQWYIIWKYLDYIQPIIGFC